MMKKLLFAVAMIFTTSGILAQNDTDNPQTRQLISDDLYVQGSLGIGLDISNNQAFGSDTMILKEDNLRIFFDDASDSGSFPANDWRFTFNSNSNGGDNYFSVDDATGGKVPFRIDAGAPNHALRIGSSGNVGIGTSDPGTFELHILDGDTPTLRLNQDGSSGWTPQIFDIAGNDAGFFIRDATNGSKLPFRIQPNTPNNTLTLRSNGAVGIGTWGPNGNASIHMSSSSKGLLINRMTNAQRSTFGASLDTGEDGMMVYDTDDNAIYTWDGTQWVDITTDTDDQTIDVFQLTNNNLELSLADDAEATKTVDLSKYLDNTDSQQLALNNTDLTISGGNTIDLSSLQDGTGTDSQTLNLTDTSLSISNGNTIDLSSLQDGTGTDSQTLNLTDTSLSISNGNTVDFSAFVNTDGQDLTSASLSGTDLTIEIENGASVTVDLSPLLTDLETRLSNLEQTLGINNVAGRANQKAVLYQNIPNPFDSTSSIRYYIPNTVNSASIVFSNMSGQVISNIEITERGEGGLHINSDGLASGTYIYTLFTDGKKVDSKRMVIN